MDLLDMGDSHAPKGQSFGIVLVLVAEDALALDELMAVVVEGSDPGVDNETNDTVEKHDADEVKRLMTRDGLISVDEQINLSIDFMAASMCCFKSIESPIRFAM